MCSCEAPADFRIQAGARFEAPVRLLKMHPSRGKPLENSGKPRGCLRSLSRTGDPSTSHSTEMLVPFQLNPPSPASGIFPNLAEMPTFGAWLKKLERRYCYSNLTGLRERRRCRGWWRL